MEKIHIIILFLTSILPWIIKQIKDAVVLSGVVWSMNLIINS